MMLKFSWRIFLMCVHCKNNIKGILIFKFNNTEKGVFTPEWGSLCLHSSLSAFTFICVGQLQGSEAAAETLKEAFMQAADVHFLSAPLLFYKSEKDCEVLDGHFTPFILLPTILVTGGDLAVSIHFSQYRKAELWFRELIWFVLLSWQISSNWTVRSNISSFCGCRVYS